MYKRLFNWIILFIFLLILSWSYYSYISAKSEIKTFDAAITLLNSIVNEKTPLLAIQSIFNHLFNLAILQVFTFLVSTVCLLFLLWFVFRIYTLENGKILTDNLTGLYNRKAILMGLKYEIERAKKFNHPLCIAVLDLDYFKRYNLSKGSNEGDKLIKKISRIIEKDIRPTDFVGRIGGEEFLIIFPETKKEVAFKLCENIRRDIEQTEVTSSIGISEFESSIHSKKKSLVIEADKRLYLAKLAGRNTIR